MALEVVAFTKLYIAPVGTLAPSPDPYVEASNIFNLGDIGIMFNEVATSSLSDGYDRVLKGTRKVVVMPVLFNYDPADLGQIAWKAAGEDSNNHLYNFKMAFNDAVTTVKGTYKFKGKVMGYLIKGGGPNDVRKAEANISIETDTLIFTPAS
jgi:hypothetical protein